MKRYAKDDGLAFVEFIGIAIVLMIPVAYLAGIVLAVGNATIAADASARAAARAFVIASTEKQAKSLARSTVLAVAHDHHFATSQTKYSVTCASKPCLTLGSAVTVSVTIAQPFGGLPGIGIKARTITSSSSHTMMVDESRIR